MQQLSLFKNSINDQTDKHPQESGVIILSDGYDAFSARLMLADQATASLDVQYYLWENDLTGSLLLEALYRAAERGVHVRLLLDDNNSEELDRKLAVLNNHPLIDIRLFNPLRNRKWRIIGNVLDFPRLNRRMHNKAFTADHQFTIIGGRNIGDEYFNAGRDFLFIDLDILAVGPVVGEATRVFDRFWKSALTYPVDRVMENESANAALTWSESILESDQAARTYMEELKKSGFSEELHDYSFVWGKIQLVSDKPEKITEPSSDQILLPERLRNVVAMPVRELLLVVPYFVPGKEGIRFFRQLRKRNIQIKILTNAFESTDVAIIHAGYTKYRKKLLQYGVQLYELKRHQDDIEMADPLPAGSPASSLHAKTFCIDRTQLFIGSCNFDPRSSMLNTEMGVLIACPSMAQEVAELFDKSIPARAYEVRLNSKGNLQWVDHSNGEEIIREKEPGLDLLHKAGVFAFSRLPVEWLL